MQIRQSQRWQMRLGWMLAFPIATVVAASDSDAPVKADPEQTVQAMRKVYQLGQEVRRLGDWSRQADQIESFMDDLWERNGWDSESDQFARRLNQEVARIPPWRFKSRLDKMSELVADRYDLSTRQRAQFEARLFAESVGFIAGNADTILRHAHDYVEKRLNHEALTPEDVRRWTEESDPLVVDLMARVDRIANSVSRDMTPAQRGKFHRDFESLHRQLEFVMRQRESWKRGEWDPEDWGLHNDPIQTGKMPERESENPRLTDRLDQGARRPTGKPAIAARMHRPVKPEDESTWAVYVRLFITRHDLDAGQREALRSILAELEERAAHFRARHEDELAAVPRQQRETSAAYQPLRDMFEELKRRAEALLTKTQRTTDKTTPRN